MSSEHTQSKSPAVAYVLWFFLGAFGAHRFYFGKTKSAVGMLCLCVGSWILTTVLIGFVGLLALTGWWIYDVIQMSKWLKGETGAQAAGAGSESFSSFSSGSASHEPGASSASAPGMGMTSRSEAA